MALIFTTLTESLLNIIEFLSSFCRNRRPRGLGAGQAVRFTRVWFTRVWFTRVWLARVWLTRFRTPESGTARVSGTTRFRTPGFVRPEV